MLERGRRLLPLPSARSGFYERQSKMAFADEFTIVETDETRRIQSEFADRVQQLSGFSWPPKDQAECTIILTRAGFSQERIEQFLNEVGFTGFEACGELPRGYVSASHGEWPIFSVMMVEGLERWKATNRQVKPSSPLPSPAETIKEFSPKEVRSLFGGASGTTVNKYAKVAGVTTPPPGGGQRHRYSVADILKIADAMAKTSDSKLRESAVAARIKLQGQVKAQSF